MNQEALFERAQRVAPGGVHSPVRAFKGVGGTPRFMRSGKGAYIQDVDGKEYLDFCMSWGPLLLGHHDDEVANAVHDAIHRGWSFGTAEPYSLELAECLTQHIPFVERIRFVSSGTEAVMSALRLARGVTGRSKVLKFQGCYHGHVDALLIEAGSGATELAQATSAGISAAVARETLVAPLDDLDAVEAIFRRYPDEIAAIIIEPLPSNHGLLPQRKNYLEGLRMISAREGSLLIFDEVITGFRVGFQGMSGQLGIEPDLVTYGKVIGGGFPVGAYGGRHVYMKHVAPEGDVYQAGTLSANPVAMVAGQKTLSILLRDQPYQLLEQRTEKLACGLEALFREASVPFQVSRYGSLFWMHVETRGPCRAVHKIPSQQGFAFRKLFHALLERGVYLAPSAFEVGFLSVKHTDIEIEKMLDATKKSLATL